jgi:hypothetical protein
LASYDDASIELVTAGISAVSCKVLNKIGMEHDTTGRAASWAVHFDRLLSDSAGIDTFSVSLNLETTGIKLSLYSKLINTQAPFRYLW